MISIWISYSQWARACNLCEKSQSNESQIQGKWGIRKSPWNAIHLKMQCDLFIFFIAHVSFGPVLTSAALLLLPLFALGYWFSILRPSVFRFLSFGFLDILWAKEYKWLWNFCTLSHLLSALCTTFTRKLLHFSIYATCCSNKHIKRRHCTLVRVPCMVCIIVDDIWECACVREHDDSSAQPQIYWVFQKFLRVFYECIWRTETMQFYFLGWQWTKVQN